MHGVQRVHSVGQGYHEDVLQQEDNVEYRDFSLGAILVVQGEVREDAVKCVDEDLVVANLPDVTVDEQEEKTDENEVRDQHSRQPFPETTMQTLRFHKKQQRLPRLHERQACGALCPLWFSPKTF